VTRRILCIDGGGIKGVFPASFLATVEDAIGGRVTDYFDLIAGTSTGGIIALGLGLGLSASEILQFYEALGPGIFKGSRIKRLTALGFSRYRNRSLKGALESIFGDNRLGDSSKRLVIPALNLENGEVHVYKTAHHPRLERDYKEKAVDVALATAAAPTYFPVHRTAAAIPLLDGGIWANNPTGMAVVEAVGVLGWPRESLRVLSLGCTSEALSIGRARFVGRGAAYWATRIVGLFMTAQSFSSMGTAYILVGHESVFRVDPVVPSGRFRLDAYREAISLKGLGASEARKALPRVRSMFIDEGPVEPFRPDRRTA
jgi:uncharacterized protein